ncbi:hypothetical protein D3C72_2295920 [compost metagenome]
MIANLAPGPDFKQFFQRSYAAGQGDKTVCQRRHTRLAGMHVRDHFQLGQATMRGFCFDQSLRNDANGFATGG